MANDKGIVKEWDKHGKWKGTYCAYADVRSRSTGRRKQVKRRGILSKEEAKRIHIKIKSEADDLINCVISNFTWPLWCEKFLEIIEKDFKRSTIKNYQSIIKKTQDAFSGKNLQDITPNDVKNYLYNMSVISEQRRKKICTNIKTIFEKAVEERIIVMNPATKIKIEIQDSELKALNAQEVQKLLAEAKRQDSEWFPIWVMALFTGMRTGELYALRKTSIDMTNKVINVVEGWTKMDGFTSTKNKKNRIIPISDELMPFLRNMLITSNQNSDFLLPHLSFWTKGEQAKHLRMFCESIGITSIKFHDLRATFITQLLRSGPTLAEVMRIVGHSSMKVTDKYLRLSGIELLGVTNQLPYNLPFFDTISQDSNIICISKFR